MLFHDNRTFVRFLSVGFCARIRRAMPIFALAVFVMGFSGLAQAADSPCQIHRIASLDMRLNSAYEPTVPVMIAGQTKSFVVATGAIFSSLMETKARAM